MPTLVYDTLVDLAKDAAVRAGYNWNFNEGPGLMAAIALAESGGNTQAHNAKPPDDSYGLWQINMINKLGPERRKAFKIKSNDELFDPKKNADAMIIILRQQGLKAWSTYSNGSYKKFSHGKIDPGTNPDQNLDGKTDQDNGLFGINGAIRDGVGAITKTAETFALNFGAIVLAGLLLVLGVVILLRSPVSSVVSKATPIGKIASTAKKVG
jgi:hypothetical protein